MHIIRTLQVFYQYDFKKRMYLCFVHCNINRRRRWAYNVPFDTDRTTNIQELSVFLHSLNTHEYSYDNRRPRDRDSGLLYRFRMCPQRLALCLQYIPIPCDVTEQLRLAEMSTESFRSFKGEKSLELFCQHGLVVTFRMLVAASYGGQSVLPVLLKYYRPPLKMTCNKNITYVLDVDRDTLLQWHVLLQKIVANQYSRSWSVLLSRPEAYEWSYKLLMSYGICYNEYSFVVALFDAGVSANDDSRHFRSALTRHATKITREFVKRGVIHDTQKIRNLGFDYRKYVL